MTPPEEPGGGEPVRRARSMNLVSVLKIAALVIAAYAVVALGARVLQWKPLAWIGSPFGAHTQQKTLETLLELTGIVEKEDLLAVEYFGEVLVYGDELKERASEELERSYDELRACAMDGGEITQVGKDSLGYWVLTNFSDVDFAKDLTTGLKELEDAASADGKALKDVVKTRLDEVRAQLNKRGSRYKKLVYLARGNVKIWYDLAAVLEDSTCRDSEGEPVENCDLTRVSKLVPSLKRARRIRTTINPYFSYSTTLVEQERKNEKKYSYTHGWEIVAEGDEPPKGPDDHEMLMALRIMAHEELQRAALASGILDHADASLARTLKQMIELFLGQSVEVSIEEEPALATCSRQAG